MEGLGTQADIGKNWTLFLDRDGVINDEIVGSYVTAWDEFKFCEGALDALALLNTIFGRIVIVTNQRGVGKGIMSFDTLRDISGRMTDAIHIAGGRIDSIYSCTAVADDDHNRKPNTGMAMQAKEDFPEVDFKHSVIVGNSITDMEFGKRVGMYSVFLTTKHQPYNLPHDLIDEQFPTLISWAKSIRKTELAS
ncbi:MAG: HAD-IIIA family hydrolase [Sphingobacteriales bacterium]|nr:MAG: HAD-IIIA family hydrolase [Sphingobacteriales bacterium]